MLTTPLPLSRGPARCRRQSQVQALCACAVFAPPRQVRPTPCLGANFSCVPASAILRSAPPTGGGLPSLGRVAECCRASRDRVGRQLRRRTRQKPEKGASGNPGASKSSCGAKPHLSSRACSARARPWAFPHLLARPSTAGGSTTGARRGQQVMAQLCEPRRGRVLLALLASLLLSGAQAASRNLDVHGEGQAGGSGSRG